MTDFNNNRCEEKGRKIGLVKIDEIIFNPDHPRKIIDDDILKAYAESIKIVGILQPILVQKNGDDKIQLVIGEMRVRAAKMAGKKAIPAIFINPKVKANFLVLSLIENIHKTPLTPLEEGEALYQLRSKFRFSDRLLSLITGKSKKEINELIEFNNLPENVKEYCTRIDAKLVTKNKLRQIAKMEEIDKADEYNLYSLFHRQRRYSIEVAKDKAMNLNKDLRRLEKTNTLKYNKDFIEEDLNELTKTVREVLK
jgi:ParB family chromosome partitioning protein